MRSRDGNATHYRTKYGYWHVRFVSDDGEVRNKNCKTKTERDGLLSAIRRRDELDYWERCQAATSGRSKRWRSGG